MRKVEEVILDGNKFTITYPTGEDNLQYYLDKERGSIFIEYHPNRLMSGEEAEDIIGKYFRELRKKAIELTENYPLFYSYFGIGISYARGGSDSGYNNGQHSAVKSELIIDFQLKNEYKKG